MKAKRFFIALGRAGKAALVRHPSTTPASRDQELKVEHPFICETCGEPGYPKTVTPGFFVIEIMLYLLVFVWLPLIIIGPLYTFWRISKRHKVCCSCGGKVIPTDSPRGRALVREYSQ